MRQALAGQPDVAQLLLVVDQFEEVFTSCDAPGGRSGRGAGDGDPRPGQPTAVVLGVRADFYDQCLQVPELVDALHDGHVPVGTMSVGQLGEAIGALAILTALTTTSVPLTTDALATAVTWTLDRTADALQHAVAHPHLGGPSLSAGSRRRPGPSAHAVT